MTSRPGPRAPTGAGLGARWEHLEELLDAPTPALSFVEVSPENYMGRGGYYDEALDRLVARWPVLSHGLSLSIAGCDPVDPKFLADLRRFLERVGAPWHSDHLCFGSVDGVTLHDLLPVSFRRSEVRRIAERVVRVQDALGLPFALENISYYLHPGESEMSEAQFLAELCDAADCSLMLDVNNAWVNAQNFGFDVDAWMRDAPLERTVQIHVAGHHWVREDDWSWTTAPIDEVDRAGKLIVDTHGAPVVDPVLDLLARVLPRVGPVPVLLERDQEFPPLAELLDEVAAIQGVYDRALRVVSRAAHGATT